MSGVAHGTMLGMDADRLTAELEQRTADSAFRGVALVWRDGQPAFSYAGGLANRAHGIAVREDTRFAVASITKLVTATAALRLVDRGVLRLDAPLVDLLPAEHRTAALTAEHTLHHLLSHTSGLPNYHDDEDKTWASFTSCWDRIPTYHIRRPADMLPLFADLPAVARPGAEFRYADANFILAGLVLEHATGKPYPQIAAEEVFGPAGMTDTAVEALDADPVRLATGYYTSDAPAAEWRTNLYGVTAMGMPDGGMITTARDLATLVDALLDGSLLSPELGLAMRSPQGPRSDAIEQYGYGCELVVVDGQVAIIGHGGSDPGVSALVSHHLAASTTIVVVCNQDRGSWAATQLIETALGLPDPRS